MRNFKLLMHAFGSAFVILIVNISFCIQPRSSLQILIFADNVAILDACRATGAMFSSVNGVAGTR